MKDSCSQVSAKIPVPAILLLGPTGSGKTPLGELLQKKGLAGRACHHFDFGACFRQAASDEQHTYLTASDLAVIRKSLRTGALLSDSEFPVARKILEAFLRDKSFAPKDRLILNGLPRHEGQAKGIADIVDVQSVVLLECRDEVVIERLTRDPAGDRKGRADDGDDMVRKKLKKFRDMTLPLVDYYALSGVRVIRISVTSIMTAESMREVVESELETVLK